MNGYQKGHMPTHCQYYNDMTLYNKEVCRKIQNV